MLSFRRWDILWTLGNLFHCLMALSLMVISVLPLVEIQVIISITVKSFIFHFFCSLKWKFLFTLDFLTKPKRLFKDFNKKHLWVFCFFFFFEWLLVICYWLKIFSTWIWCQIFFLDIFRENLYVQDLKCRPINLI